MVKDALLFVSTIISMISLEIHLRRSICLDNQLISIQTLLSFPLISPPPPSSVPSYDDTLLLVLISEDQISKTYNFITLSAMKFKYIDLLLH